MKAAARAPASCGELVEGEAGGRRRLISLPVSLYATVTVWLQEAPEPFTRANEKCRRALEIYYGRLGRPELLAQTGISVTSDIPAGKGMASSTADVSAALYAASCLCGAPLKAEEIAEIAVLVEPSDSVMFPELCLFDFLGKGSYRLLGPVPRFEILVLEGAGQISSVELYGHANRERGPELGSTVELAAAGVERGDIRLLAQAARKSAEANQGRLRKPYLARLDAFAFRYGLYGYNIAHSGTVAGLWHDGATDADWLAGQVRQAFPGVFQSIFPVQTVAGGVRLCEGL